MLLGLFDNGSKDRGVDKVHEEESLEYGVRELGGLLEEFGRFGRIAHDKAFHLRENVKELGHG